MKKIYIISAIYWICVMGISGADPVSLTPSQNYIVTVSPLDATGTVEISNGQINMDPGTRALTSIQYFDGLGRPIQTVQKNFTPAKADLVSLLEYDAWGRDGKVWLPVPKNGNNGAFVDPSIVSASAIGIYNNDSRPYSEPEYEASLLNRIKQQFGPGEEWKDEGRSVRTSYLTNTATVRCAYYFVNLQGNLQKSPENYAENELFVTQITDEDNNVLYEFKDKFGQVILTRQINNNENYDTYYVYDDFGNLCFVLPPMASGSLTQSGIISADSPALKNYAYVYQYDRRNRNIMKKLPGCYPEYMIYDRADQLIFHQNGEQQINGEWSFSIPDAFGRTVLSGTCINHNMNSAYLENTVVSAKFNGNNSAFKYYDITGVNLASVSILTVSFYDNYDFLSKEGFVNLSYDSNRYNTRYGDNSTPDKHRGLLTGTMTALLDGSGRFIYSAKYYDDKKRLIQSHSTNHLQGFEREHTEYDFSGQVKSKYLVTSTSGGADQIETYVYEYDHSGRLKKTTHQWGGKASVVLAENVYNELGQLSTSTPNNLSRGRTNYKYNIRSWLTEIDNPIFKENLKYSYSGNINQLSDMERIYASGSPVYYEYTYDNLSRLTKVEPNSDMLPEGFMSTAYSYDKNGNILHLLRNGMHSSGELIVVDDLDMQYNGNQLKKINQLNLSYLINPSYDFKDYSNRETEYVFNRNGAMVKDLNKGISQIVYNKLDLPSLIDIKSPVAEARNTYTYDASGNKLRVVQSWNPNYQTNPVIGTDVNVSSLTRNRTTDYLKNKIYGDGVIQKILTDNGYIESDMYHFYIKDHLGNNAYVIDSNGNEVEYNHYYPFGLSYSLDQQEKQPYKYNSKEFDSMHGLNYYDYGARHYDAAIGRWQVMDPQAEKYYSISPYTYCNNNPVNNIDPNGEDYWSTNDPDLIRQFLLGYGSDDYQHDFTGWYHVTDAQFTSNFAYNDETGKVYTSYGIVEDGVPTIVGHSFDANITPVSYDGSGYPGAFVYKPRSGFWDYLGYYLLDAGASYDGGLINWKVNTSGRITGAAPVIGYAPMAGKGGRQFIKGYGKMPNSFHAPKGNKFQILKAVGENNFKKFVGSNPNITVVNDKIVLQGVGGGFKGKTYNTGLNADDFLP